MIDKPLHKAMQNLMKQTNQQTETKPTLFPYSMQPNIVMFEQRFEIQLWKMFISFNMVIPVFLCKPHLDRLIFLLFTRKSDTFADVCGLWALQETCKNKCFQCKTDLEKQNK